MVGDKDLVDAKGLVGRGGKGGIGRKEGRRRGRGGEGELAYPDVKLSKRLC